MLLHGLGASSPAYFARTATSPVLANRSALLIDFLGFGISDRPTDFGDALEYHPESIARGLDALGLAGIDVVAHSMGGSIALVLATRRPDLMTRLVLAEPNLGPTTRPRIQPLGRGTTPQLDRLLVDLPVSCALTEGEHTGEPVSDPVIAARGIPLFTVPGAGQTMMLDNPGEFAQAVADALDFLDARGPQPSAA